MYIYISIGEDYSFIFTCLFNMIAVTLVVPDPVEVKLPLLEKPLHFYANTDMAPDELTKCNEILSNADAFIVASAEYNRCIPPALSNLLDHFGSKVYSWKPSGIICYSAGNCGVEVVYN